MPALSPELEGLRVAHLSDFHLGVPSRGERAAQRAAEWVAERRPDIVCITGDLLSHPRGHGKLRQLLQRTPGAFAVLGNHDYGVARDPFAKRAVPYDARPARLLLDESETVAIRGRRIQLVGLDPRTYIRRLVDPVTLVDESADLRILLCHYPRVVDRLPRDAFHLVLAGHLHDGQITIPYVLGKLRLAHPQFPYPAGVFQRPSATLHVSPGLGTTFVPFRFGARPEATELVLRAAESRA